MKCQPTHSTHPLNSIGFGDPYVLLSMDISATVEYLACDLDL